MKSIDTIRLRKFVGWLGFSLAWIVLVLCVVYQCVPGDYVFPASISATYFYAPTITPFMIILGASSILLMCYRGYTWVDDLINTVTGIFGLGICLFPTYNHNFTHVGTFQVEVNLSSTLHNICAVAFFVLLSINVLFLFTKSNGEMTKNKKIRNIIYRVCGAGMIVSMICLVVLTSWAHVWWAEAFALMFFGIAFLTKADVYPWLFCDSKNEDKDTDNA